jgi:hypothetical protein
VKWFPFLGRSSRTRRVWLDLADNRRMLPVADDLRLLVLPAEEVFDLAPVIRVVEDVADGGEIGNCAGPGLSGRP